jgi:hypothetical protein
VIAAAIQNFADAWTTVYHGHSPIVELIEADFGAAIWPLFDYIDDSTNSRRGYGHYHEEYRKVNDDWLINCALLARIRGDWAYPSTERPQSD